MIGDALAYIALAALLGLALHLGIYRLVEAISLAWIDAQSVGQVSNDPTDSETHGDTRTGELVHLLHGEDA